MLVFGTRPGQGVATLTFVYLGLFSVRCLGQVSTPRYRFTTGPGNFYSTHRGPVPNQKQHFRFFDAVASYLLRREQPSTIRPNLNPRFQTKGQLGSNGPSFPRNEVGMKTSPVPQKRFLDPIAGNIIKKESNKRFLDPIASEIIRKSSGGSDGFDPNADSNMRLIDPLRTGVLNGFPRGSYQVSGSTYLPHILFHPGPPIQNNEFGYGVTADAGDEMSEDSFGEPSFAQNPNDFSWQNSYNAEGMQDTEVPHTVNVPHSKIIRFNDSFNPYQSEHKISEDKKRFLDSIAGEIIRKNVQDEAQRHEEKRYLDNIGSSLVKRAEDLHKRYREPVGSSLLKRQSDITDWENGIANDLIDRDAYAKELELDLQLENELRKISQEDSGPLNSDPEVAEKRYLDGIASSLIKKSNSQKRYLDGIGSSLIKKEDGQKRYLDGIASTLIKRYPNEKRYLDGIGSSLIKKDDGEKRYLDGIGSSLIKKEDDQKRYLDGIGSSLIKKEDGEKRYLEGIGSSLIKKEDGQKRYLDGIGSSLIKKEDGEKRYLDGIGSSLIKKEDGEKRYLDGIGSSLIKKEDGEKRYLDGIGSSLIKKEDGEKRYLDGIGSSLIKKEDGEKRYLDGIGSSLIKKEDGQKRYLDGIGSSLIKKEDEQKRYLDGIGSSLIKKEDGQKRYLDGIGRSLIKKEDDEKRYLDGIGSSLIKKEDDQKRYLDGIGSSLIKKEDDQKRYLDGIGSSLIKKEDGEKRYLDGIGSSLIKKQSDQKRYLDGIGSSLIKKGDNEKRYLDGIGSSLIKKEDDQKRYLDGIGSSLIKKEDDQKRYLDGIGSSLIKKEDDQKRYLDGIGSSLIKKDDGEKRYLDGIGSSLIKKDDGEKRYLDGIGSSLIKKDDGEKRYLDGIGSSLIKKEAQEKRYLDNVGSSLIKRNYDDDSASGQSYQKLTPKRDFEVTDDVMDGSKEALDAERKLMDKVVSVIGSNSGAEPTPQKRSSRKRRDVSILPFHHSRIRIRTSQQRKKRFIDSLSSNILYKRLNQQRQSEQNGDATAKYQQFLSQQEKLREDRLQAQASKVDPNKEYLALYNKGSPGSSFAYIPSYSTEQSVDSSQSVNPSATLMENPSKFQFSSSVPESFQRDGIPKSVVSGTFWTFNKIDPVNDKLLQAPPSAIEPAPYSYSQVRYPNNDNTQNIIPTLSREMSAESARQVYKRFADYNTREQNKVMADPFIDEIAATNFRNNKIFKKRYLDNLASSLLHKRYLDSLGSSLIKRSADSVSDSSNRLGYTSAGSHPVRTVSKRFNTKSSSTPQKQFDMNHHISALKRYIDSIASSLLYKRGPKTSLTSRAPRRSTGYQSFVKLPRTSIASRIQTFDSQAGDRRTLVGTSANRPRRPILTTATMATGQSPTDSDNQAYLHSALRNYVNNMTKQVLAKAKKIRQKQNRRLNDVKFYDAGRYSGKSHRWSKWETQFSRDFFDSLAGGLLN